VNQQNHNDTEALQKTLDNFAAGRGGHLALEARKYTLEAPLRIHGKSISIDGGANGFSNSPNAEHESETGSELCSVGDALYIGNHDPELVQNYSHKLGAINLRNLYFWGPGADTPACAICVDHDIDQNQYENIHIGNYGCGFRADSILDAPTIRGLDIIHCRTGVEINALTVYVRLLAGVICDNDGIGIVVKPETKSFGWVISDSIIIRNSRVPTEEGCNIFWGGNHSNIVNNIIQDAGHDWYGDAVLGNKNARVPADGLILVGDLNVVASNQFEDHVGGCAVVVRGHHNQICDNSFSGNKVDIRIEAGATDTVIVQRTPLIVEDHGTRTTINGVGQNAGDPEVCGEWKEAAKSEGLILHDKLSGATYQYSSMFPGGRIRLGG
jgi:hypothetical protein